MLHKQGLKPPKVVRLKATQYFDILLRHFEGSALEVYAAWSRSKDEGQIDVEDRTIVSYHDVGIISIFEIQEVLCQAKT